MTTSLVQRLGKLANAAGPFNIINLTGLEVARILEHIAELESALLIADTRARNAADGFAAQQAALPVAYVHKEGEFWNFVSHTVNQLPDGTHSLFASPSREERED